MENCRNMLRGRCLLYPTRPGQFCEPGFTDCNRVVVIPSVTTTCTPSEDGSFNFCRCDGLHVTDPVGERCFKIPAGPGDQCDPTFTPCDEFLNTTCVDMHCICDEPLITDPEKYRCLTLPTLPGHPCHPSLAPCTDIEPPTVCKEDPSSESDDEFTCRCFGELPITDPEHNICIKPPSRPGDKCHPKVAPCDPLSEDTECVPGDGFYFCQCTDDQVTDPVNGRCLTRPTAPGDVCDPDLATCEEIPLTDCTPDGEGGIGYFCKCEAGYITAYGRCVRIPLRPGDECHPALAPCDFIPDTNCVKDVDNSPAQDFFSCKCNSPFITDRGYCFTLPNRPGDRCSPEQAPCTSVPNEDTDCSNGDGRPDVDFYCYCHEEQHWTDLAAHECVDHPRAPGNRCDSNHTATTCNRVPNSSCNQDSEDAVFRCTCDNGHVPHAASCVALPTKPMDPCWAPEQCDGVEHTECHPNLNKCTCRVGYDLNLAGSVCLKRAALIGDQCESSTQCSSVPGTECYPTTEVNGTCRCLPGLFPSSTGTTCLAPVHTLGQWCMETVQCTAGIGAGSTCDADEVCACVDGYVPSASVSRCLPTAGYQGSCDETAQCMATLGPRGQCDPILEKCTCSAGSGHMNAVCHELLPLGISCLRHEECILGTNVLAHCHPSLWKCECGRDAITWSNSCYADLDLGDRCEMEEECSVPIYNGTCTREGVCGCKEDAVPVADKFCHKSSGQTVYTTFVVVLASAFLSLVAIREN